MRTRCSTEAAGISGRIPSAAAYRDLDPAGDSKRGVVASILVQSSGLGFNGTETRCAARPNASGSLGRHDQKAEGRGGSRFFFYRRLPNTVEALVAKRKGMI